MTNLHIEDIRDLRPKEKVFFIFSIGAKRAYHNANWAVRAHEKQLLKGLEIYKASERPMSSSVIPFILVSSGDFERITDPHIKEHEWKEIDLLTLEQMVNNYD